MANPTLDESQTSDAIAVMHRINRLWLNGNTDELALFVHPEIVMVFPGFSGHMQGREAFLAGFHDFSQNAKIHDFHESDLGAEIAGNTAVVSFRYNMHYERSGQQYHATGRDLWVFQNESGSWIAVWRTMLEMEENVE